MRPVLLALAAIWPAACSGTAPQLRDVTPPKIVLTALGAVGNPSFASDEPVQRKHACLKFRSFPARFVLSVGDSGGVALATVRVARGRVLPESVIVGPDAPESSWEIARIEGFSEMLLIRLNRPSPSAVRTGILVMFNGAPDSAPANILATAYDHSGNVTALYPLDVGASSDHSAACG